MCFEADMLGKVFTLWRGQKCEGGEQNKKVKWGEPTVCVWGGVKTRGVFVSRIRLFLGVSPTLCLQTNGDGWSSTLKQWNTH